MTRKDYIRLAEALRFGLGSLTASLEGDFPVTPRGLAATAQEHFAAHVAEALKEDNPRFDTEHFLAVVRGEKDLRSHPPR